MTHRSKRCIECHELFHPDPRVPNQCTCSKPECQRKRKNKNQANLRKRDKAYRQNDRDSSRRFRKREPGYWKKYRAMHPEYTERNRILQRQRNQKRREQLKKGKNQEKTSPATPCSLLEKPLNKGNKVAINAKNSGIATRGERSAVLLLNEGVKSILNQEVGGAIRIANVDLIYANPKQIQAIRSI